MVTADSGYTSLDDDKIGYLEPQRKRNKVSAFTVFLNLVMSGLGAGVLSLPWAMAGASIVPSVVTTFVVMALNVVTIMILVFAGEQHQAFDLGALLAQLPGGIGPMMQAFCNVLTCMSVFLTLVGYIVVMADSMEPSLESFFFGLVGRQAAMPDQHFWFVRAPVLGLCVLAVLPVCFIDQKHLAVSSVVGICVTIYLFAVVTTLFARKGVAAECCVLSSLHEGTITMFSTLMQCAVVQMCILPMYKEMENRTPKRFGQAVVAAFLFLAVLFSAFAAVAYGVFGPYVHGNMMTDLPHDALGGLARIGMILVMLAVYPIMMLSLVAPIRHWEDATGRANGYFTFAISICIVVASSIGAAFVGELGALNAMNGSMQVSCFIGLAPGLTGLYLMGRKTLFWRVAMYSLLSASLIVSVLGMIYTSNAVDKVKYTCIWGT